MAEAPARVAETPRLALRQVTEADAAFIFDLVNQPSWLRYIGDKQVRNLDDARAYLRNGPLAMYARHGFGLWCIERRSDGAAMGLCGLIRREGLEHVDIGYALLPQYWSQGYALEAAAATLLRARALGLKRVVAITSMDNGASSRLLEKLGMKFERTTRLTPAAEELKLYAIDLQRSG